MTLMSIVGMIVGLLLLIAFLGALTGWRSWRNSLSLSLLLFVLTAAGSIYFDQDGAEAPAVVVSRQEGVSLSGGGAWTRTLDLTVRYQLPDTTRPVTTAIDVDPTAYDRLGPGSTVTIRYLPLIPTIARLDQQTTLAFVRSLLTPPLLVSAAEILASLLVLLLVVRALRQKHPQRAIKLTLAWMIVASLLIVVRSLRDVIPADTAQTAQARVTAWTRVVGGDGRCYRCDPFALQPYDQVVLEFTPVGMDHPVKAVDAVDRGSLPNLATGQLVAVAYAPRDPRAAQLVGGTRRYLWLNSLALVNVFAALFLIAGVVTSRRGATRLTRVNRRLHGTGQPMTMDRLARRSPGPGRPGRKIEAGGLITAAEASQRLGGPIVPPEQLEGHLDPSTLNAVWVCRSEGSEDRTLQVQVDQADPTADCWSPLAIWERNQRLFSGPGARVKRVPNLGDDAYWLGDYFLNVLTPSAVLRFVFPDGSHYRTDVALVRGALARLDQLAPPESASGPTNGGVLDRTIDPAALVTRAEAEKATDQQLDGPIFAWGATASGRIASRRISCPRRRLSSRTSPT